MEIPQHWRLNAQRYGLTGSVCETCGTTHFPPRAVCPDCSHNEQPAQSPEPIAVAHIDTVRVEHMARSNGNGRVGLRLARHTA